jgi:hypothetical protein
LISSGYVFYIPTWAVYPSTRWIGEASAKGTVPRPIQTVLDLKGFRNGISKRHLADMQRGEQCGGDVGIPSI